MDVAMWIGLDGYLWVLVEIYMHILFILVSQDIWQNLAVFDKSNLMKSNIHIVRCLNSRGRIKIWIVDLSNALGGEFLDFLSSSD